MAIAQILDLCYLSDTFPPVPPYIIGRDVFIEYLETQLDGEQQVAFVDGEPGVGISTLLSQFAKKHNYSCVSYFIKGVPGVFPRPSDIKKSIAKQLYFYAYGKTIESSLDNEVEIEAIYLDIIKAVRIKKDTLYFVFDGFSHFGSDALDSLRQIFSTLPWKKAKFIFSGQSSSILPFLPPRVKYIQTNSVLRFSSDEVCGYLKHTCPDISDGDITSIYSITKGLAKNISFVQEYYSRNQNVDIILSSIHCPDNLYEFELEEISITPMASKVLALLTYSVVPLHIEDIISILDVPSALIEEALKVLSDHIVVADNVVSLRYEGFRKFLWTYLISSKKDIELLLISFFERSKDQNSAFVYLPSLYKSTNNSESLLSYLSSANVRDLFIQKQSQAALNEQCEYGFRTCENDLSNHAGEAFRFAINKSSSKEIEKNELWDSEIEALLAVGETDKAFSLANNIFILEERLKSFLIIAVKGRDLSATVKEELRSSIDYLCGVIDFEHIPDKSFELAKLMIPYDFEKSLVIIERLASISKDQQFTDKLYTIVSLSASRDITEGNLTNFDVVNSRIQDGNLRQMTKAMKSIFEKDTSEQILSHIQALPNVNQRIFLLQYWIPDHLDVPGIGDIVLYAINCVIETSNVDIPKASLLSQICCPLPKMAKNDIIKVAKLLDDVQESTSSHSVEYTVLSLSLIEAIAKFDEDDAYNRLTDLYLLISDISDKSIAVYCKSLILGRYNNLGSLEHLEASFIPQAKLLDEIDKEISSLLVVSAYHLKILEGPIKALVSSHPSFIQAQITKINTIERRSRASLIAAKEYCQQKSVKEYDWDYIRSLIEGISYDVMDRAEPLKVLTHEIINSDESLDVLTRRLHAFKDLFWNVEHPYDKAFILVRLYNWLRKQKSDNSIVNEIRDELMKSWDKIDIPWMKLDVGFYLSKKLSLTSQEEAKMMLEKVSNIKSSVVFSSLSCVNAFVECLDLYVHSIGILIRKNMITKNHLFEFKNISENVNSYGDSIILWSKIALEYKIANNEQEFKSLCSDHINVNFDNFSDYDKKRIVYNIAPCLFYSYPQLLWRTLDLYDESFRAACLHNLTHFIYYKHPYPDDISISNKPFALSFSDYSDLLQIMEKATDDNTLFEIVDVSCKSLKENIGRKISNDQRNRVASDMLDLVKAKFPTHGGIQHDGYKIACEIAIDAVTQKGNYKAAELNAIEARIQSINNFADISFVYFYCAAFLQKSESKLHFLQKGFEYAERISSSYDKANRFDLCLNVCLGCAQSSIKGYFPKVIDSLLTNKDSDIRDYKNLIDLAYEYDEHLADLLIEKVDQDPARQYSRKQLRLYADSNKRIKNANKNFQEVNSLSVAELRTYFKRHLSDLIKGTVGILPISESFPVLKCIYDNSIVDTSVMILYFMENASRQVAFSASQKCLIENIYDSLLSNLNIILSLSSDTQERLKRIDALIQNRRIEDSSVVGIGERDKAIAHISDWFSANSFNSLFIIDPYFSPDDMDWLKVLFDINLNINIEVLAHKNKSIETFDEYNEKWSRISEISNHNIKIHIVYYKDDINNGPLHDRWWIGIGNDVKSGIKLSSVSSLGNKETDIENIPSDKIDSIIQETWVQYVLLKKNRVESHELVYVDKTVN